MNNAIFAPVFALATMLALDARAQDTVGLFTEAKYGGTKVEFPAGDHNAAALGDNHDMTVKSIKVPIYLRAILYKHEDFENYEKGNSYQNGKWGPFEAAAYGSEDLENINVPEISSLKVIDKFPSKAEVMKMIGKTWQGNWDWPHDDEGTDAAGTTTLTILSENKAHYSYHNGVVKGDFDITFGHGGADARQPVVIGFTLPDGNILRFEFLSTNEVSGYFWQKGMQAGQKKHRPPQARAILRLSN